MTSKRRKWVLVLAGVVVASVITLVVLAELAIHNDQPFYQGRSYSSWLGEYEGNIYAASYVGTNQTCRLALRAIGTNALPTLLRWVAHNRSQWSIKLESLVAKLPGPIANLGFFHRLGAIDRRPAFIQRGFHFLGPEANPAVPELTRLMRAPDARDEGDTAALALACIGPAGCNPLLKAAAESHATCQRAAVRNLGQLGTNAVPALPFLLESLGDNRLSVHAGMALNFLDSGGAISKDAIPALRAALDSPHEDTRLYAASKLVRMGAELDRALPILETAPALPDFSIPSEPLTNTPPR